MNTPIRQETSRERRSRETRAALLDSAEQVFCEQGYAGAALDVIVSRAGFTKGAIYAHFTGKSDLFLAVQERRSSTVADALQEIGRDRPDRRAERLGAWLAESVRTDRNWLLAATEFAVATARDPELAARRRGPTAASAVMLGEVAGGAHLGEAVLALVNGLILRSTVDPDFDPASVLSETLDRLVTEEPA